MLNFVKLEKFAVTVNVELPSDTPGKPNKGSFTAVYKYLDRAQLDALAESLKNGQMTDETFLDAYLISVSGIGEGGKEFEPAEQRRIVYQTPALTLATVRAFLDSITGAGRKN